MPYEVKRRTCTLDLGADYEGANVKCKLDVSMDLYFEFMALDQANPESIKSAMESFGREVLISWEIEEDGEKLPADADGLKRLPPALVLAMIQSWAQGAGDVPLVSAAPSLNGSTLAAASIPLDE